MAHDEDLADRIRGVLPPDYCPGVEKPMFGGLAFLRGGHLAVAAANGGGLLLRVDSSETDEHVRHDGVTRFEMRGRPMDGWVRVDPAAVRSDADLRRWAAQVRLLVVVADGHRLVQAIGLQGGGDVRASPLDRLVPQREQLLRGVVGRAGPLPVGLGLTVDGEEHLGGTASEPLPGEADLLDPGHVLEQPAQRDVTVDGPSVVCIASASRPPHFRARTLRVRSRTPSSWASSVPLTGGSLKPKVSMSRRLVSFPDGSRPGEEGTTATLVRACEARRRVRVTTGSARSA